MAAVVVDLGYEVVTEVFHEEIAAGTVERNIGPVVVPLGKRAVGFSALHVPGGVRTSRIEVYPTGPDPETIGTQVSAKLRWEPGEITSATTVDVQVTVVCINV